MEIASEKNAFPKEWLAPYMNRGEIHRSWKHMRPVAHLWAALCNFESGIKLKSVEAGPAALIGVLRLAAAYLDWGATQKVPGINGTGRIRPLIDKEKAWNLPPSVATLPLPALAPDMLPDAVKSAAFGKRGAR